MTGCGSQPPVIPPRRAADAFTLPVREPLRRVELVVVVRGPEPARRDVALVPDTPPPKRA